MDKAEARRNALASAQETQKLRDWVKCIEFDHLGTGKFYYDIIVKFSAHPGKPNRFLQVSFWAATNNDRDAKRTLQRGRKWYISPYATKSEVILTAWMATKAAIEHEIREEFLYNGERIFGPHISVDALYGVARAIDARQHLDPEGA